MDSKLKVWIHCRVTNESEKILLEYQKVKIMDFLDDKDIRIIGVSQEVNAGRDPHSIALDSIRIHVRRGEIDFVLVTDKTRLLVSEERYQEFKLFCYMHSVQIIDLQNFNDIFQNHLLLVCL